MFILLLRNEYSIDMNTMPYTAWYLYTILLSSLFNNKPYNYFTAIIVDTNKSKLLILLSIINYEYIKYSRTKQEK